MNGFTNPKVFRANISVLKSRMFLTAGIVGVGALVWGLVSNANVDIRGYGFAGGLVLIIFSLRFWLMMVRNGPSELTFDNTGITLANKVSRGTVLWGDLQSIRYIVWRGGHYWEVKSRAQDATLDFYLDGLTGQQRKSLQETITSINLPNVQIVPFYDPFGLAQKAAA